MPRHATAVQFQTALGNVEVLLFDETTPQTIDNFLDYVISGDWICTVFHRTATRKEGPYNPNSPNVPFVVQGQLAVSREAEHFQSFGVVPG